MISVCSYCRRTMGEKAPYDDPSLSHGICDDCYPRHMPPIAEMKLNARLASEAAPVLVIDGEGRIVGLNAAISEVVGRPAGEGLGLRHGELVGCPNASLPGACRATVHCGTCSIRKTVERTRVERSPLEGVEVTLETFRGRVHMRVSAYPREDFVKLVVDEVVEVADSDPG
jgi:PAS domain-containing protein